MDLDAAWAQLDHRFQTSLQQAWVSLGRRGLPVGAVVALDDDVLAVGRNRVYDPPGGADPLQRTPLAHAEMNALASLSDDTDFARCSIWSTHVPCAMCEAAIKFTGLAPARYLANDPSDEDAGASVPATGPDTSLWAVVANAMFLHNVGWVSGRDNPIMARYARREPEITSLAMRLLDDRIFISASASGDDLPAGLLAAWDSVIDVTDIRIARA